MVQHRKLSALLNNLIQAARKADCPHVELHKHLEAARDCVDRGDVAGGLARVREMLPVIVGWKSTAGRTLRGILDANAAVMGEEGGVADGEEGA